MCISGKLCECVCTSGSVLHQSTMGYLKWEFSGRDAHTHIHIYTLLIATVISWTLLELAAGRTTEKEEEREGSKKEWSYICDDLMQRNNVKLNLKWNFLICPLGDMYYPYTFSLLKFFNMQSNKVWLHDCQSYNDVHQHTKHNLFYVSSMEIMNEGQSNLLKSKLSCLRISQLISNYSRCLFTFIHLFLFL